MQEKEEAKLAFQIDPFIAICTAPTSFSYHFTCRKYVFVGLYVRLKIENIPSPRSRD
jgi:hypothetical protein